MAERPGFGALVMSLDFELHWGVRDHEQSDGPYRRPGAIHLTAWHEVRQPSGLCDIPASMFLRGFTPRRQHLEPLRLRRIARAMQVAAVSRRIIHLWWHPHFGAHTDENIAMLRQILSVFDRLRDAHGMRSMSMGGVVDTLDGS